MKAARIATFEETEVAATPTVCSSCLGPNPLVRMLRLPSGKRCHACNHVYSAFSWRASNDAKTRMTILCRACSASKMCCQSCMCDLATGLSAEKKNNLTTEELAEAVERQRNRSLTEELERLGNDERQLKRKFQQKACTFWAKGFCSRGKLCPFLHSEDGPTTGGTAGAAIIPSARGGPPQLEGGDDDAAEGGPAATAAATVGGGDAKRNIRDRFQNVASVVVSGGGPQEAVHSSSASSLQLASTPSVGATTMARAKKGSGFDASWMGSLTSSTLP